jgi:hypothetical protein
LFGAVVLFDKIENPCDQQDGRYIVKGESANAPQGVRTGLAEVSIQPGFQLFPGPGA